MVSLSLANDVAVWFQDELDEEFQKQLAEHKEAAVARTEKKRAKRLVTAATGIDLTISF